VDVLVLASEIGGACVALQLMTGLAFPIWAVPVALLAWALLWYGNFATIEYGVSLLGLLTVVFVVAAFKLHPQWSEAARALGPSLPTHDKANYWFLAVGILGATISPYLFNFYSSGAVEDQWTEADLPPNRITATLGMGFGGCISAAVLICAACVLYPRGIRVDSYEQAAMMMLDPFGAWGIPLFAACLVTACFGAALQVALNLSYLFSQGFGWNWSENLEPHDDARFALVYTAAIPVGALLVVVLGDPLQITTFSMALNALLAPVIVFPLLVLMNDRHYVREYRNHVFGNVVVSAIVVIAFVIAAVAIPLEVLGG
jgi:Mn2+/Fe2+ NRAMP family transporter